MNEENEKAANQLPNRQPNQPPEAEASKETANRFLSSDETQPIESGRSSRRSDIGVDVGPGSEKTSIETDRDATRIQDGMTSHKV